MLLANYNTKTPHLIVDSTFLLGLQNLYSSNAIKKTSISINLPFYSTITFQFVVENHQGSIFHHPIILLSRDLSLNTFRWQIRIKLNCFKLLSFSFRKETKVYEILMIFNNAKWIDSLHLSNGKNLYIKPLLEENHNKSTLVVLIVNHKVMSSNDHSFYNLRNKNILFSFLSKCCN